MPLHLSWAYLVIPQIGLKQSCEGRVDRRFWTYIAEEKNKIGTYIASKMRFVKLSIWTLVYLQGWEEAFKDMWKESRDVLLSYFVLFLTQLLGYIVARKAPLRL